MTGHDLALALRAAYFALHRRTDALMSAEGVTADQFVVLCALAEGPPLTQRQLVEKTASDPNTLRAMLVLLERRELLERKPHPTDGRARCVSLTRKGRRVFQKLWSQSEAVREDMLAQLSENDLTAMVTMLRRFAVALERARTTAANSLHPVSPGRVD